MRNRLMYLARIILLAMVSIGLVQNTCHAQMPIFADTSTYSAKDPELGQFIRMYPRNFILEDNDARVVSDAFFDSLYQLIISCPECIFEIGAHTTVAGPAVRNFNISQKRAISIASYLIRFCELPRELLETKGYGESMPIFPCTESNPCSPEEDMLNQRIECTLTCIPTD